MKLLIMILILLFQSLSAANYDTTLIKSRTNIAGSLAGPSLISFHIEYQAPINEYLFIAMSTGVGYQEEFRFFDRNNVRTYATIPNQLSLNFGNYQHSAEVGLGLLTVINANQTFVPYTEIAYRYQPKIEPGKPLFRIYFALPYGRKDVNEIFFIPFGFSIGIFL